MSQALEIDDFKVGLLVTVLEPKITETHEEINSPLFPIALIISKKFIDKSGMGEVLEILAIDLPFIVVKRLDKYKSSELTSKMDIRGMKFKKLTQEYAEALIGRKLGKNFGEIITEEAQA